jgi:hypothetical protein
VSGENHSGAFEQRLRAMCSGFRRAFSPTVERVLFGGREMTLSELMASLEAMEATFDAVHCAEVNYRQAVSQRRRAMKGYRSDYEDAVVFLKHQLGKANPRLVEFGLQLPKQRRPLTVEAQASSRVKAAATRKARGVMSRKQRLAIGRPPEPTLHVFGLDAQASVVASAPGQTEAGSTDAPSASVEPHPEPS